MSIPTAEIVLWKCCANPLNELGFRQVQRRRSTLGVAGQGANAIIQFYCQWFRLHAYPAASTWGAVPRKGEPEFEDETYAVSHLQIFPLISLEGKRVLMQAEPGNRDRHIFCTVSGCTALSKNADCTRFCCPG
jgi:hypothetical protein